MIMRLSCAKNGFTSGKRFLSSLLETEFNENLTIICCEVEKCIDVT